jgi:stage III sporulation protein AH
MKIWKKNAVLATVILFVCVAVYLNWSYGRGEASAGEEITGAATEEETDLGDTGLVNGEGENDSLVALDENEGT